MNTTRIDYALRGILKTAPNLTEEQKAALKPIVAQVYRMAKNPSTSNELIHRFASAAVVLGTDLMRLCECMGKPHDTTRDKAEMAYAKEHLVNIGVLNAEVDQKFAPPEVLQEMAPEAPEVKPKTTTTGRKSRSKK